MPNKIRVLSLFGGIGCFEMGLERAGIPFEVVDYVDNDKFAVKSYNAIWGTNYEPQDICKWDKDVECDLICHGSPCQSFSVAGLGAGGDEGSGTRSSLMWETVRIVEKINPKYIIWENVKGLLTKKHRHNFDAYLETMENLGYKNYYQVMNAKNYGTPQNRERVFTISIREDVDRGFKFPDPIPLDKKLKDILEKEVDEKYYLSDKTIAGFVRHGEKNKAKGNGFRFEPTGGESYAHTVTTKAGQRSTDNFIKEVGKLNIKGHDQIKRVYSSEGVAPTLTTMEGGNRQPKILENNELQFVGGIGEKDIVGDGKKLSRNYPQGNRVYSTDGIAVSLTANGGGLGGSGGLYLEEAQPVKRRRSEYGKKVRKAYENHELEHSEEMREYYVANDGIMPTVTASKREQKIAEPYIVASRGRGENNEQHLEPKFDGTTNTITTVQKDNYVVVGDNEKPIKEVPSIIQKQGDRGTNNYSVNSETSYTIPANPMSDRGQMVVEKNLKTQLCDRLVKEGVVQGGEVINHSYTTSKQRNTLDKYIETKNGVMPTITTRPDILGYVENNPVRIRKLTPRECWRLQSIDDEKFDKAAYNKYNDTLEKLCSAKLRGVIEKREQNGLATYALNITNALQELGITSTVWTSLMSESSNENIPSANVAIEMLGGRGHLDSAISITKCLENGATLCTLMDELDQNPQGVIIGLGHEGEGNTEKYMKITLAENLSPQRLFIILTLIKLITKLKIYGSTLLALNMQKLTINCVDYGSNMEKMPILSLETVAITARVSNAALYKQAGNGIAVCCPTAIFSQLFAF